MEVLHISQLFADLQHDLPNGSGRVTYQDPCRLGRHLGVYDAPRSALTGLGLDLVEMERTRQHEPVLRNQLLDGVRPGQQEYPG